MDAKEAAWLSLKALELSNILVVIGVLWIAALLLYWTTLLAKKSTNQLAVAGFSAETTQPLEDEQTTDLRDRAHEAHERWRKESLSGSRTPLGCGIESEKGSSDRFLIPWHQLMTPKERVNIRFAGAVLVVAWIGLFIIGTLRNNRFFVIHKTVFGALLVLLGFVAILLLVFLIYTLRGTLSRRKASYLYFDPMGLVYNVEKQGLKYRSMEKTVVWWQNIKKVIYDANQAVLELVLPSDYPNGRLIIYWRDWEPNKCENFMAFRDMVVGFIRHTTGGRIIEVESV